MPAQGGGRIDNPGNYSVFYSSNAAAGAIAEAFGRFPEWTAAIWEGSPSVPTSVRAIARYALADDSKVCNLDDPAQLLAPGLRPSDIVTRDYTRSRSWAKLVHEQGVWAGVRWWSYCISDLHSSRRFIAVRLSLLPDSTGKLAGGYRFAAPQQFGNRPAFIREFVELIGK